MLLKSLLINSLSVTGQFFYIFFTPHWQDFFKFHSLLGKKEVEKSCLPSGSVWIRLVNSARVESCARFVTSGITFTSEKSMRNLASSAAMLTEIKDVSECRLCIPRCFIQATRLLKQTLRAVLVKKQCFVIAFVSIRIRIRIRIQIQGFDDKIF